MTRNQIIFSSVLGAITLLVVFFSIYVASSTMWADRWMRRKGR